MLIERIEIFHELSLFFRGFPKLFSPFRLVRRDTITFPKLLQRLHNDLYLVLDRHGG